MVPYDELLPHNRQADNINIGRALNDHYKPRCRNEIFSFVLKVILIMIVIVIVIVICISARESRGAG